MEKDKKDKNVANQDSIFLDGLREISKKVLNSKLNEEEKAQFEKAQFAEEQVKKSQYAFGGRIY